MMRRSVAEVEKNHAAEFDVSTALPSTKLTKNMMMVASSPNRKATNKHPDTNLRKNASPSQSGGVSATSPAAVVSRNYFMMTALIQPFLPMSLTSTSLNTIHSELNIALISNCAIAANI